MVHSLRQEDWVTRRPVVRVQSHVLTVHGLDDTEILNVQFAHFLKQCNRLLVRQWAANGSLKQSTTVRAALKAGPEHSDHGLMALPVL